ncbi:MAG TPA: 1,4-alpha-glucan branching protein domain-containing protein [Gemmatimonadales bacterium]|nr:1,4-alpha-glucan branching protein domain-containing protein [Gemmatimonadales bacterium]
MDFILALHSHLPYVLNHGRWPHGSDWLCEAALDTYLPLLEALEQLADADTPAPITIGFTPVLANQLADPAFARELDAFFELRLAACDEAAKSLPATGDAALLPLLGFWRARFCALQARFRGIDRNIVAAFRKLEQEGRLEIIGSAATHGYLPLLGRDESIRLQLAVGRAEHRRLFGRDPVGCWLPECGYRPRGIWSARAGTALERRGVEEHLADAGFGYFFTDAHLARAGGVLGSYGDVPLGAERFDAERHEQATRPAASAVRSPHSAYRVSSVRGGKSVAALVRDPASSMQIWSRHQGYPGDGSYLEFHKMRWPGGLKFWRVTGPDVDLGAKQAYEPAPAFARAADHASHFAHLLASVPPTPGARGREVVVAPFDTELYGHWWFEGVEFLGVVYRRLSEQRAVRPVTAGRHLEEHPPQAGLRLAEGSWGANGDHSMWLNDRTAWMWQRLWALEDAFWDAAPAAATRPEARPILAQAARELVLAQASDWEFIVSTAVVADYGVRRFELHCQDAERLVAALAPGGSLEGGQRLAEELWQRDRVFPDILASVAVALRA